MNHKTQVSRLGTGSFISYGRRKSRLKERISYPTTLGETKWQRLLTEEFSTILKLVKRKLSSLRNNLFTEALLYKELSKMIVVTEILLASVVFLAIIYAEAQLLYNYK